MKSPADSAKLPFFARATLASAAAWSPNPKNPPLYLDLPMKDGEHNRRSWRDGRRMLLWHSWTSTSEIFANTAGSRSMLEIRMGYEATQANFTMCSISMESRTASKCTRALTRVSWLIVSKIM